MTSTIIVGGTTGPRSSSNRSRWGSHTPWPLCGSTTQATGMAVPRYSTLRLRTTIRPRSVVASMATGKEGPPHQSSTHASNGAKQVVTSRRVAQGAARSPPS
jgi:hypothetical protein